MLDSAYHLWSGSYRPAEKRHCASFGRCCWKGHWEGLTDGWLMVICHLLSHVACFLHEHVQRSSWGLILSICFFRWERQVLAASQFIRPEAFCDVATDSQITQLAEQCMVRISNRTTAEGTTGFCRSRAHQDGAAYLLSSKAGAEEQSRHYIY